MPSITGYETDECPQSPGEEIANSVIHGPALLAAIAAVPLLFVSTRILSAAEIVGHSVFAATMVLLYLTSTLFHALPTGRAKRAFLKLDHCAIYVFIAGSYAPFALGALHGAWGWYLVWIGVVACRVRCHDDGVRSTVAPVAICWTLFVDGLAGTDRGGTAGRARTAHGTELLVAGGLAYTVGIVFFALGSSFRYAHALWHAFVVAGSVCHFFAVLGYAS